MADTFHDVVDSVIGRNGELLGKLGKEIWSKPEVATTESFAMETITSFLSNEGFNVDKSYHTPTGFRAAYSNACDDTWAKTAPVQGDGTPKTGARLLSDSKTGAGGLKNVNVCFVCQYDALPELGHASGNNLTTEASVAAAMAVKRCLQDKMFCGTVTVLGAPAVENCGGSKIDLVTTGAFEDIDFALMLSPLNENIVQPTSYTLVTVNVVYKGKASHASAYPWEGHNALDAAVSCYNNIALLRSQVKPTWIINGIIKRGGVQPNIVPAETELVFWLRAPDQAEVVFLQQKATACFVAAAKATGCEVSFDFDDRSYFPMQHNNALAGIYEKHAKALGMEFTTDPQVLLSHTGSNDLGNVSQVVPALNPTFDIATRAVKHSEAFTAAAGSDQAQEHTLRAARALARTAIEVMISPNLLEDFRDFFTHNHELSLKVRSILMAQGGGDT